MGCCTGRHCLLKQLRACAYFRCASMQHIASYAEEMKQAGNIYFREENYLWALGNYMDVIPSIEDLVPTLAEGVEHEQFFELNDKLKTTLRSLYSNCAMVSLLLKRYLAAKVRTI